MTDVSFARAAEVYHAMFSVVLRYRGYNNIYS